MARSSPIPADPRKRRRRISRVAGGVVGFPGTLGRLSHVWYYQGMEAIGPSVTAGALAIRLGVWLTARR